MWAKHTQQKSGFTIVELLIVIVVIGILAAITIVAYNGIQTKAKSSAVQSLVSTMIKKSNLYRATTGRFPTADELKYNYAPGTTVAGSGPAEAAVNGDSLGSVSPSNGTNTVRYVNQDANCGWFDWWDYENNRITTLSTVPTSTRIGC